MIQYTPAGMVNEAGDIMTGALNIDMDTPVICFRDVNSTRKATLRFADNVLEFLCFDSNGSNRYATFKFPRYDNITIDSNSNYVYDIVTTKNKILFLDSCGDVIPNGTDVDTLGYGLSYVANKTNMRTMINTPFGEDAESGGEFITVQSYSANGTYDTQFLLNTASSIFYRKKGSSEWGVWRAILNAPLNSIADNVVPRFNNTYGVIQGSAMTISDSGTITVNSTDQYPLLIRGLNSSGTRTSQIVYDCGNATNVTSGQFRFSQYSPNTSVNTSVTGFREIYNLPIVTSGLTEDVPYDILTTKTVTFMDNQSIGPLGWTNKTTDGEYIPTINTIAYWNGRYNSSASNLQYCKLGAFGSIVTAAAADYVNITSAQTIAGVKTFTSRPIIDISANAIAAETGANILSFKYQNPNEQIKTVNVIRTYGDSETATNNGIAIIGSNSGAAVIGAGEGTINTIKLQNISNNENIHLIADGGINFFTNAGSDSNAATNVIKIMSMTSGGIIHVPKNALSIYANDYPMIRFRNGENSNAEYGAVFVNISNGNLILRQRMGGTYYENYHLPGFNTSGTSAIDYHILTTKGSGAITETSFSAVSIASATSGYSTIGTFSIDPGTYIIKCMGEFAANTTGYRLLRITTNGSTVLGPASVDDRNAVATNTICNFTFFYKVTSSTLLYLSCRQNSGSALKVSGKVQCIRIL